MLQLNNTKSDRIKLHGQILAKICLKVIDQNCALKQDSTYTLKFGCRMKGVMAQNWLHIH
jgi:hypothetical protein